MQRLKFQQEVAFICLLLFSSVTIANDSEDMRFSDIDSFGDFLEWMEEELEQMKRGYQKEAETEADSDFELIIPELTPAPSKDAPGLDGPLDLTLPETAFDDDADFKLNDPKSINMPDLFSNSDIKDKETPSTTSFGGRLLMDEGFEELEQYRFQDIKNSIRGAELTFEVKTN